MRVVQALHRRQQLQRVLHMDEARRAHRSACRQRDFAEAGPPVDAAWLRRRAGQRQTTSRVDSRATERRVAPTQRRCAPRGGQRAPAQTQALGGASHASATACCSVTTSSDLCAAATKASSIINTPVDRLAATHLRRHAPQALDGQRAHLARQFVALAAHRGAVACERTKTCHRRRVVGRDTPRPTHRGAEARERSAPRRDSWRASRRRLRPPTQLSARSMRCRQHKKIHGSNKHMPGMARNDASNERHCCALNVASPPSWRVASASSAVDSSAA